MARKEYNTPKLSPGDVEVKLSYRGIGKLLKSSQLAHDVRNRAERVALEADRTMEQHNDTEDADQPRDHHRVTLRIGKSRVRARVYTNSLEAYISEQYNRTLTKALDEGRNYD